jgi:hypothetical protein
MRDALVDEARGDGDDPRRRDVRIGVRRRVAVRRVLTSPSGSSDAASPLDERRVYAEFQRSVAALGIPPDAVLHPTNISSSVSY